MTMLVISAEKNFFSLLGCVFHSQWVNNILGVQNLRGENYYVVRNVLILDFYIPSLNIASDKLKLTVTRSKSMQASCK